MSAYAVRAALTAYDIETIDADHYDMAVEQERAFNENGEYVHIPTFEIDNTFYSVTEYRTPKNEVGYQTIITTDNYVSSKGYGPEAESRTYEIYFSDFNTNSPTSTLGIISE